MTTLKNKIEKISSKKPSSWIKDADFRLKNRKWLRYSSNIARRVIAAIEDRKDFNQVALSKEIGVSPQYISKVIKGKQNLSLETIGKLSEALKVELIEFPDYKYTNTFPTRFDVLVVVNGFIKLGIVKNSQQLEEENPKMLVHEYFEFKGPLSKEFINKIPILVDTRVNADS